MRRGLAGWSDGGGGAELARHGGASAGAGGRLPPAGGTGAWRVLRGAAARMGGAGGECAAIAGECIPKMGGLWELHAAAAINVFPTTFIATTASVLMKS